MPHHFADFIEAHECPSVILVPKKRPIGSVIEDLLLIWQLSDSDEWVNTIRRLPF